MNLSTDKYSQIISVPVCHPQISTVCLSYVIKACTKPAVFTRTLPVFSFHFDYKS